MNKDLRINVRVSEALKDRIKSAKEITGLPETVVVTSCLEAYCDYVEKHNEFVLPIAVIPKNDLPEHLGAGVSDRPEIAKKFSIDDLNTRLARRSALNEIEKDAQSEDSRRSTSDESSRTT